MARKQTPSNPLFGASFESGEQKRKPTILQFVKRLPKNITEFESTVELIWLPGNFDNYTLECEHFRVPINNTHPLYSSMREGVDRLTNGSSTVNVCIQSKQPLSYKLVQNSDITGHWQYIGGDSGIRFFTDRGNEF
jgi:3',5'-cyclic AMP phosphodiesterase CpdA